MVNYETFYLSWRTWDLERDDFFVLKAVDIILSHVYCVVGTSTGEKSQNSEEDHDEGRVQ